jgi:hypothetical protein
MKCKKRTKQFPYLVAASIDNPSNSLLQQVIISLNIHVINIGNLFFLALNKNAMLTEALVVSITAKYIAAEL